MKGALEGWPSGRRRTPGKCVYGKPYRGFESRPLRHFRTEPRPPGVAGFTPAAAVSDLDALRHRAEVVAAIAAAVDPDPLSRCPGSSIASAGASIGWNSSGPTAPTTPAKSKAPSPPSRRRGWRSSNVPITVQDLSSCRSVGSPNGPSPGSAEIAAWPETTRTSPTLSRPSSLSPPSSSPSRGSRGCRLSSQALSDLHGRRSRGTSALGAATVFQTDNLICENFRNSSGELAPKPKNSRYAGIIS
jgi:hypothetical protein